MTTPFGFDFFLHLSKKHNLRFHLHNPGEEFWFFLDVFPMDIFTNQLVTKDSKVTYFDIRVRNTIIVSKNTNTRPCSETGSGNDYISCIKSKVIQFLIESKTLNCSSVFTNFLYNWQLPTCKSVDEATETFNDMQDVFHDFLKSPKTSGCLVPCNVTMYSASLIAGFDNLLFISIQEHKSATRIKKCLS